VEQEGKGMNVFEDRDGDIWYGTSQRGVVWFQPRQDFIKIYQRDYSNPASLADDGVHGFLPVGKDEMFVGTSKGLSKLTKSNGRFFNYTYSVTASGNYPAGAMRSLTMHGDTIIMATDFGLSFYNKKTAAFKRVIAKDEMKLQPFELFANGIAKTYYTVSGELLLMEFNGGAARYDIKTGHCFYSSNSDGTDSLFSFHDINSSAYDTLHKKLWVESGSGQLHEYDLLTKKSTRHFYEKDSVMKTITAMAINSRGAVWLATNNGLVFYDPKTKKSPLYPLPATTQNLFNVAARDGETIWVTTTNEVVKLDANTGKAVSFNLNALLPHVILSKRSLLLMMKTAHGSAATKAFAYLTKRRFNRGKACRHHTW
jgi:ligand-binding sensor domain-containing protein